MIETLNYYLSIWYLTDPQLLAETPTSHVYTVTCAGETVVLKLLTDYGWEEQRGATALRFYDGHGAVRLYAADEHVDEETHSIFNTWKVDVSPRCKIPERNVLRANITA